MYGRGGCLYVPTQVMVVNMFRWFKPRPESQQQERDDGMLLRVYRQGHHAGMAGLPCTPPAGYEGLIGLDLIGTWTAGWDGANRELPGAASSRSAA